MNDSLANMVNITWHNGLQAERMLNGLALDEWPDFNSGWVTVCDHTNVQLEKRLLIRGRICLCRNLSLHTQFKHMARKRNAITLFIVMEAVGVWEDGLSTMSVSDLSMACRNFLIWVNRSGWTTGNSWSVLTSGKKLKTGATFIDQDSVYINDWSKQRDFFCGLIRGAEVHATNKSRNTRAWPF